MKFLRRQRRQKDVKSIRGKNGRLHSLSSLKYRLSRLLFVAPFTFHRQYFRAIWRVDSLAKLKCIERLLFAIQRELLREKNRPTPHPFSILIYTLAQFAHTTCFRRIFSTGCVCNVYPATWIGKLLHTANDERAKKAFWNHKMCLL